MLMGILNCSVVLTLVIQKVDSAIQWINLCSIDKAILPNTYLLDSDLSGVLSYPSLRIEDPGNEVAFPLEIEFKFKVQQISFEQI